MEKNICSSYIPNAFLERSCVDSPSLSWCEYTCEDGYRINEIPAVLNSNHIWGDAIYIFCRNGTWKTLFEDYGHKMEDICLPEGLSDLIIFTYFVHYY